MDVQSRVLSVVSMMSWIIGVILLLLSGLVAYPYIVEDQFSGDLIPRLSIYWLLAGLFFISGLGVWKQKKPFNIVSFFSFLSLAAFSISTETWISWVGVIASAVLAMMLASRWYVFR
jgi:uncharacterized membrane protein YdjX (TVP38/TMEM64 family)